MSTSDPAVQWPYALLPLLALAACCMHQPSGRLLGLRAAYSAALRASPILCGLDALVLVLRCVVYCIGQRVGARRALQLCCRDLFDEREAICDDGPILQPVAGRATRRPMVTSSAVRAGVVAVATMGLVSLRREAPATVAWGGMYVGSYVMAELALQTYEHHLWLRRCAKAEKAERAVCKEAVAMAKSTTMAADGKQRHSKSSNATDEKDAGDTDTGRAADPPPAPSHGTLSTVNYILCIVGAIMQAVFVCWAFLDLVQPGLARRLPAIDTASPQTYDGVHTLYPVVFWLAIPMMVVVFLALLVLWMYTSSLIWGVISRLGAWARGYLLRYMGDGTFTWVIIGASHFLCVPWGYYVGQEYVLLVGNPVVAAPNMWIHAILTVEVGVLVAAASAWAVTAVLVAAACVAAFDWRVSLDSQAPKNYLVPRKPNRIGDVYLISLSVFSLAVSTVWYIVRFADSGHWWEDWTDGLTVNEAMVAATVS